MSPMFERRLTPVGLVVMSCFAVLLLAGYVARVLFPESPLGSFLGTGIGLLAAVIGAWIAHVLATVVLALAGYPCFADQPVLRG